ncbi:MAG: ABC transporter substrate-binding protein, partial [Chloroflexi bacterium]|nr:ABC transporter substrate-binding protein [Chloroflexota bacterium]
ANPGGWVQALFEAVYSFIKVYPPEPIQKLGARAYQDWRNSVGTGAFMLVDFIPDSSATFVRNPNYWMKDPVGPGKGNQLPYLDGAKILVIGDRSTRLAALRTAKTDWVARVKWEDFESMIKMKPDLKYKKEFVSDVLGLALRLDKPEQPWYDIRVRRALQMAIDLKTLVKDYFAGEHAQLFAYPAPTMSMYKSQQLLLEETSPIVQEMFSYNPEKAKKLLAEAGYPNGFKMEVIVNGSEPDSIDALTIAKEYWSKIGVTAEISVKERGVFTSISTGRTHKEGIFLGILETTPYAWHKYQTLDPANRAMLNDPVLNKYQEAFKAIYVTDEPKAAAIIKEAWKYIADQAYYIQTMPGPYTYTLWWPWVKNYHGEWIVGYTAALNWPMFIWYDQSLKKSLGF